VNGLKEKSNLESNGNRFSGGPTRPSRGRLIVIGSMPEVASHQCVGCYVSSLARIGTTTPKREFCTLAQSTPHGENSLDRSIRLRNGAKSNC